MSVRAATALAFVLTLTYAQPGLAWDPFAADEDAAPLPAPTDPAPFVAPPGLYLVTDVYTGNAVTTNGNTTTYSTTTAHDTPGTYARVIDTVGTGVASAYDGAAMNGRTLLPDGRAVAGTYYEDYVLTSEGYLSVNIVFFQDDAITVVVPVSTAAPATAPANAPRPSAPAPQQVPTPAPRPTAVPTPRPVVATAGVALGETAPALTTIEVLRGRRVALWPRAFLDGIPVRVRSWRLVSGYVDLVSVREGDATTSCDATWLTLAEPGSAWVLRFEITTDAAPGRLLTAAISVVVRSPALEQ